MSLPLGVFGSEEDILERLARLPGLTKVVINPKYCLTMFSTEAGWHFDVYEPIESFQAKKLAKERAAAK